MIKNKLFQVLSIRSFFFLLLSEICSQLAMNMVNFVLIVLAFQLSSSSTAVSGIVVAFTIPSILFGLFAGVYVDKKDKKQVLFATNLIRGILVLVLAMFHGSLSVVYFLTFSISVVTQFFIPAESPMIPLLVPKNLLHSANALFGLGIYGSLLLAFMLSGVFLYFFGQTNTFLVLSIIFLLGAFCTLFIKGYSRSKERKFKLEEHQLQQDAITVAPFAVEVRNAVAIIMRTKKIYHSIFLLILSQIIILIIGVIGPGYAEQVLGIPVVQFPLLFITPATLGMAVAALVLGNLSHRVSKARIATWGVYVSAVAMLLLVVAGHELFRWYGISLLHIMIVLAFCLGLGNAMVFVPSNTILQEETSDQIRGKVYGALNALTGIFSLLPVIVVGGLADIIGIESVMIGIALILFLIGGLRFSKK